MGVAELMGVGTPLSTRPHLTLLGAATIAVLALVMTTTGAAAASAAVNGPDVSSHNHENRAMVNWHLIHHGGGASFAFVKATEGVGYVNPSFASDFAAIRAGGMIRGAYHFARPSGVTGAQVRADATAEANFFIRVAGPLDGPGNLPAVLDLEDAGSLNPTQLGMWARTWLNRVEALTGRTPILYTNAFFWVHKAGNSTRFAAHPLWLASYGVVRPAQIGGWNRYTFWQHTETGRIYGASRLIDLSVFFGSFAQLELMASATPETPMTAETPVPPVTASTRRFTTRADAKPADTKQADAVSSDSRLRAWLRRFGLALSPAFVDH